MKSDHSRVRQNLRHDPGSTDIDPVQLRRWESSFSPALSFSETSEHSMYYGAHLHDTMEIIWTRSEQSEFVVRGHRLRMVHGDVVIIAPNEIHSGGSVGSAPFNFASLHVPYAVLDKLFEFNLLETRHIFRMPAFQFIDRMIANKIASSEKFVG